jgi:hypothetical protein
MAIRKAIVDVVKPFLRDEQYYERAMRQRSFFYHRLRFTGFFTRSHSLFGKAENAFAAYKMGNLPLKMERIVFLAANVKCSQGTTATV